MLQPYVLPPDPSITPTDAGETIQVLASVGRPDGYRAPIERAPVREYAEPWLPEGAPASLGSLASLVPRVLERHEPLTVAERAWLERAARHPAQAELARLARAPDADIVGTRWDTSTFANTSMVDLPIIRFGAFRNGASVHLAMGLLAADRGDLLEAETMFRDVISVGLLLVRSGPTLIETLIGSVLAQNGANALRAFYASTGRTADANAIRFALEGTENAEAMRQSLRPLVDSDGSLSGMMAIAANRDLPPGVRWESLRSARLSASCQNASTALFGPDAAYGEWLEHMHASLVRFPSDNALFQILEKGPTPPDDRRSRGADVARRLLRLAYGDHGPAGTCAGLATAVAGLY